MSIYLIIAVQAHFTPSAGFDAARGGEITLRPSCNKIVGSAPHSFKALSSDIDIHNLILTLIQRQEEGEPGGQSISRHLKEKTIDNRAGLEKLDSGISGEAALQ